MHEGERERKREVEKEQRFITFWITERSKEFREPKETCVD